MPIVPVPEYTRQVAPAGPSVAPKEIPAIRQGPEAPLAAFGPTDMSSSVKVLSDAVGNVAADALAKANQVAVQDADNKLAALVTDIQFGKNGAMNKKGKDALALYDDVKTNFEKSSSEILSGLQNDDQRAAVGKLKSNYWQNLDSNVQRHMASEFQKFGADTYEAGLKNQQTLAASNFFDPKQVAESIAQQHGIAVKMGALIGQPADGEWVKQKTKEATSDTLVEVVKSMLVNGSPKTAKGFFEKNKEHIDPGKAIALEGAIDGKMIYDTVQKVSAVADTMRLADGQIDRARVDGYIKTLKLDPEDAYKVSQHVEHLAAVDASQLVQQRTDAERRFANELIQAQASGMTYDQALKIPAKYGWDNISVTQMQAEVTKIYASPQEKFNTWITREPQDVQSAWAETVNTVKTKYGNIQGPVGGTTQKLADAALNELKQAVLGKNADQIRQITADKLKNVVVSPGMIFSSSFFPTILGGPSTAPAWKVDANTRRAFSEAFVKLEKDYGADTVGQARSWCALHHISQTPTNVKKLLDSRINEVPK